MVQGCGQGPGVQLAPSEGEKESLEALPCLSEVGPWLGTHLAGYAGGRLVGGQEAAGHVGLVYGGWSRSKVRKSRGAGCGGQKGIRESAGSQETGTYGRMVGLMRPAGHRTPCPPQAVVTFAEGCGGR